MSRTPLNARQYGFRSWYQIGNDEPLYVCVPAKCGATSFQRAINPAYHNPRDFRATMLANKRGPFAPHDIVNRPGKKLLAVRDPLHRFVSLWRNVLTNTEFTRYRLRINRSIHSADELLSYIISNPMANHHWYPQYGYMVNGTELVRYDRLLERLGFPNEVHNQGPQINPGNVPEDDVRAFYAADQLLWEVVR